MINRIRMWAVVAVAVVLVPAVSGCGDDGPEAGSSMTGRSAETVVGASSSIPTIELVAFEHAFAVPAEVAGGAVRVTLDNEGDRVHMVQLARVHEGRTVADVIELLAAVESGNDPGVAPSWFEMTGVDFSPVGPGHQFALLTELGPGSYVAFCLLRTVDGSHALHGMVAAFTVKGRSAVPLPQPEVTLVVDDDGFTLPAVRAGRQVVALRNDGQHPHQFEFGQLHEGASIEDAATFLQDGQRGELPAEWAGGILGVAPGETVLAEINLDAGQWSVVDVGDAGIMTGQLTVG